MSAFLSDLPAILGGTPLAPAGPPAWPPLDEAVTASLHALAADGSWGRYVGPHGERLTERLSALHGGTQVVLCSSGRAAIELALRGLGVREGDDVALAAYDFYSNLGCVLQVGARPVLVDVRADDAQLDLDQLEAALTPQTRAIIASHLHGGVVDMSRLRALADARNIGLIEDAAQASGADIQGRPAGTGGDVGVLSFGGSKLLTAGRGGALLTHRADVVQRVRRHLRGDNHAYPLSEVQAAVLWPQLDRLPVHHAARGAAVAALREATRQTTALRLFPVDAASSPAYYKVGLFYNAAECGQLPRARFVEALRAEGLDLDVGFTPLHTMHSPRRCRMAGDLPQATHAGETLVGLHHPVLLEPVFPWHRLAEAVTRIQEHAAAIQAIPR